MFNFIRANLYKGFKSKTFVVLMAVSIACTVIMLTLANGVATGTMNQELSNMIFLFSDSSMLALLGAMLASIIIGAEFETKWFHQAIVAGYSRLQIVIGKAITYWVLLICVTLPYAIGVVLVRVMALDVDFGMQGAGFLNIVNGGNDLSLMRFVTVLAVMLLIYVGQLSLTILFAFVAKKAMLIIPMFYIVSALSGQVSLYAASVPALEKALNATPFGSQFIALSPNASNGLLLEAVVVSVSFMIVVSLLAFVTFRKAELK